MNAVEYSYHTEGSDIEAIENHIVVDSIESVGQKSVNGIIILGEDTSDRGIRPRWAHVSNVGPDQDDVSPGQWILVKHGEWTRGTELNGKIYRRVNPKEIFLVSDTKPE